MFFGMSFCLPIGWAYDYMQHRKQSSKKQSDIEPLLAEVIGLKLTAMSPTLLAGFILRLSGDS